MRLVGVLCWVFLVHSATNVLLIMSIKNSVPAGVARWSECWPPSAHAWVKGLWLGVWEREPIDVSLPPIPSLEKNKK